MRYVTEHLTANAAISRGSDYKKAQEAQASLLKSKSGWKLGPPVGPFLFALNLLFFERARDYVINTNYYYTKFCYYTKSLYIIQTSNRIICFYA